MDSTLVSSRNSLPPPLAGAAPSSLGWGRGWEGRGGRKDLRYLLWLNWTGPWLVLGPCEECRSAFYGYVPTQKAFLEKGMLERGCTGCALWAQGGKGVRGPGVSVWKRPGAGCGHRDSWHQPQGGGRLAARQASPQSSSLGIRLGWVRAPVHPQAATSAVPRCPSSPWFTPASPPSTTTRRSSSPQVPPTCALAGPPVLSHCDTRAPERTVPVSGWSLQTPATQWPLGEGRRQGGEGLESQPWAAGRLRCPEGGLRAQVHTHRPGLCTRPRGP